MQAGAVAEEVLLGSCEGGDGKDRRQAAMMADAIDAPDPDRLLARLRKSCRYLVERRYREIDALADRLFDVGTVADVEVDEMVAGPLHRLPHSNPFVIG